MNIPNKTKGLICILLITFLAACSKPEWPSEDYINEYNYKEVGRNQADSSWLASDRPPMYPNGTQGIADVITNNAIYPEEARKKQITGRVVVEFVVEKDGYARQMRIARSLDPLIDNEAIRVIKLLKRWIPGRKEGQFVNVLFSQPITFSYK